MLEHAREGLQNGKRVLNGRTYSDDDLQQQNENFQAVLLEEMRRRRNPYHPVKLIENGVGQLPHQSQQQQQVI